MQTCINPKKKKVKLPSEQPCLFSSAVLNDNWYERRLAGSIDKKAVAPAIIGRSKCVSASDKSTYAADFKSQTPQRSIEDIIYDRNCLRVEAFRNRVYGNIGNIRMFDGKQFVANLATTTDISYRILPQSVPQPRVPQRRKLNTFSCYGNATQTGLGLWLKCEAEKEIRYDISVTHTDYVTPPMEPIVRAKGRK